MTTQWRHCGGTMETPWDIHGVSEVQWSHHEDGLNLPWCIGPPIEAPRRGHGHTGLTMVFP